MSNAYDKWLYDMRTGDSCAVVVDADGDHTFDVSTVENSTAHRDLNANMDRMIACHNKFYGMETAEIMAIQTNVKGIIEQRAQLFAMLHYLTMQAKIIAPEGHEIHQTIARANELKASIGGSL